MDSYQRRIFKTMLFVVLAFAAVLVVAWFWLTQPLLSRPQPSSVRTVDPVRLEPNVRKLAVDLSLRNVGHLENLDRAAAYIARAALSPSKVIALRKGRIAT